MNPAPQPRVVIKNNTVRDAAITIILVVLAIGLLVFGVTQLREKPKGNALTGEIIGREFTPMKEQIVEFSGRHLKQTRESDGEFVLKVRVDSEGGRVFDVPVTKATYQTKKEGDSLTFVRPKSEQK
jgi:hypothetical protein